jgi:hypothetical protein
MNILRRIWRWFTGDAVCYDNCPHNPLAWCKRRHGHWGKHSTAGGFTWSKK